MRQRRSGIDIGAEDLLAIVGGALAGVALGFVLSENIGRVNTARIRRAADLLQRRSPARPGTRRATGMWTVEDAERLEARVLDALNQQVVLARRPIRVNVLGLGLVELTGRVSHAAEVALAGDVVASVEQVDTVLNHLLVEGVDQTTVPVPGPSAPRAARG
jgi:hypothetical protein